MAPPSGRFLFVRPPTLVAGAVGLALALTGSAARAADGACLACHDTAAIAAKAPALRVTKGTLAASVHAATGCLKCHPDAAADGSAPGEVTRPDHPRSLAPATCLPCHEKADRRHRASAHGAADALGDPAAPTCAECHGTHDMRGVDDPASPAHRVNAPLLCGRCHRLGEPVRRGPPMAEGYPMAIHGAAFFGRGSVAAAACVDCHGGHTASPRKDDGSPIAPGNMAATCGKCHRKIDETHAARVDPAVWKDAGRRAPCDTCHPPHDPRKVSTARARIVNDSCLFCHAAGGVARLKKDGIESPLFDGAADPSHGALACDSCHAGIGKEHTREEVDAEAVNCGACHRAPQRAYDEGAHAASRAEGRPAPTCAGCHGTHAIAPAADPTSAIRRNRVPDLCGRCHGPERTEWAERFGIPPPEVLTDYGAGVHGHAVTAQGSTVAAVCSDCHDPHGNLPAEKLKSREGRIRLADRCGACHQGIYERYAASVHEVRRESPDPARRRPGCPDCHQSHENRRVKGGAFQRAAVERCGVCHAKLAASYKETIHGKTLSLGLATAAECSDCHGAHGPMAMDDPASPLSPANRLATCRVCHPAAGEGFTSYLAHADHTDPARSATLHYVYRFMTGLLAAVFTVFGLHMLLWTPRSIHALIRRGRPPRSGRFVRRFDAASRITHGLVVVSFLLLAATGMALKFAWSPWADELVALFGGVAGAGRVHRISAVVTFGYFFFHLWTVARRRRESGEGWIGFVCGRDGMWFCGQDLRDLAATVRWFLWRGPRPVYGRFTYWEKFDYFAVFWGVPVIGLSGLVLWFPEAATRLIPGWGVNVAHLIHSDEALLAVGFIFLSHFFHTHFRPETFPLDVSVFTGLVPEEAYRAERGREVERMQRTGTWEGSLADPPSPKAERAATLAGGIALAVGLILLGLIVWGLLHG